MNGSYTLNNQRQAIEVTTGEWGRVRIKAGSQHVTLEPMQFLEMVDAVAPAVCSESGHTRVFVGRMEADRLASTLAKMATLSGTNPRQAEKLMRRALFFQCLANGYEARGYGSGDTPIEPEPEPKPKQESK